METRKALLPHSGPIAFASAGFSGCFLDSCLASVMETAAAADSLIQLESNGVPDVIAVSFAPSAGGKESEREKERKAEFQNDKMGADQAFVSQDG